MNRDKASLGPIQEKHIHDDEDFFAVIDAAADVLGSYFRKPILAYI